MPTELVLYFAGLAALGLGAVAVTVWILSRNQDRRSDARRPRQKRASGRLPPLVQVILPARGTPLIWVVDGRRVEQPELIEEPALRAALEEFVARVQGNAPEWPEAEPQPEGVPAPLGGPKESVPTEGELLDEMPDEPQAAADGGLPVVEIDPQPEDDAPPQRNPLGYDEELERPFLDRMRDSFFNRTPPRSTAARLDEVERRAGSTLPRFDALEEIFRERLAMHPEAPPTTIRTGRSGLLEIVVEGKVYEHIDEVPFPAVRETMREAVRIWERRIE